MILGSLRAICTISPSSPPLFIKERLSDCLRAHATLSILGDVALAPMGGKSSKRVYAFQSCRSPKMEGLAKACSKLFAPMYANRSRSRGIYILLRQATRRDVDASRRL